MDWGLANRLSRIIKSDGRCVMLAIDHGYFLGPLSRLEKPGDTVAPLLPYADALMLTRGVLRTCIPQDADVPMVLRMSGGNSRQSMFRQVAGRSAMRNDQRVTERL